ncbi:MAG: Sec-independent protein translocase subunit TatA/TatB [Limisphaerales bacterium]
MFAAFLGGWEWIIVVLAVLMLFGAKKIPELARGLGTGIKEFKKATRDVTDELQNVTDDKPQPEQPKAIASTPQQPAQTVSQSANPPKV